MTVEDLLWWLRGAGLEIVLLAVGSVLAARLARWLIRHGGLQFGSGDRHSVALAQAAAWLASATIYVMAALFVLVKLNLPLTSLVPPATVAGVAVGFGAQRIVADLLTGFFLFAERQLGVGDVVRISAPGTTTGVTGTVEELTLRTTRLRTVSGDVVFIPNGEVRQVTNLSMDWGRVIVDIPLASDAELGRAVEVLRQTGERMAADPRWADALLEAPVASGVETLDVGFLRLRVTARVAAPQRFEAGRELRLRIADSLREAGIRTAAPIVSPQTASSDG